MQKHFVFASPTSPQGATWGWQGFADVWLPKGGAILPELPKDGAPCVVDFKTCKTFRYAKSSEDLAKDAQATTYAFAAAYLTRSPVVDLVWLYLRTDGVRQAKPSYRRVKVEDAAKRFLEIDEIAKEIDRVRLTVVDPLALPPSPSHCDAFGGCPHRGVRCNLSPGEIADGQAARSRINREQEGEPMSAGNPAMAGIMARLAAKAAAANGEAPAAAAPTPPPSTVKESTEAVAALGINPQEKDLAPPPTVAAPTSAAAGSKGKGKASAPAAEGTRIKASATHEGVTIQVETGLLAGESIGQACTRIGREVLGSMGGAAQ